jgi:hypothetical protein
LEAGTATIRSRFFHFFELQRMGSRMTLIAAALFLGCTEGNVMRFAAGSGLLLERGERDLGRALEAKAELVRGQLLPPSLQDAILNKAVVDATHSPCIAIAMNTTGTRAEMLEELRADTSITVIRRWEFPHSTDIQALEYRWRGTVMHTYLFLEPGSGLLLVLSAAGEQRDEAWFRRSVHLPKA